MKLKIPFAVAGISALAVACAFNAGAARADARNDMSLSIAGSNIPAAAAPAISFTTYVHGASERQEMNMTSPVAIHLVSIQDCDQNKYMMMDTSQKIYTSEPMESAPNDLLGIPNFDRILNAWRHGSGHSGSFTNTVTVKDLGMGTPPDVAGTAHHFSVDSHRVSTGAAGGGDTITHSDIWIDPGMMRPSCPAREKATRTVGMPDGGQITYTLAGDVDLYNHVARFLPVEIKVKSAGGDVLTFKRTSAALATQDASLFVIPSDYKQVSLADFTKAEQNAALDSIAGPQPNLPGK